MKPKIFVTRELPKEGMELLHKHCDVACNPYDRVLTKQELIAGVQGKDALLCLLTDTVDKEVIDANPSIKIISNYAVGFNNVDVGHATSKKIPVTNTPGVLTETTADLAFTLMVAAARRISESERFMRAKRYKGWAPQMLLGHDIYGKTLGIVGFGRIGQAVARRAALGFRMKVLYADVTEHHTDFPAEKVEFDELLKESDFVSIHVPLTGETKHLFSAGQFSMMKDTAILINTSRGPVVDEKALAAALKNKEIAAAALDVFENEPEVNPLLYELDNAVIVPHIGSATIETRTKMAVMAAENLIKALAGEIPPNIVNREVYG